jgi:hypothetical protein
MPGSPGGGAGNEKLSFPTPRRTGASDGGTVTAHLARAIAAPRQQLSAEMGARPGTGNKDLHGILTSDWVTWAANDSPVMSTRWMTAAARPGYRPSHVRSRPLWGLAM